MRRPSVVASALIAATLAATGVLVAVPGASPAAAQTCLPDRAPADEKANEAVWCLLSTLDQWADDGVMGIGQQLDVPRRGQPGDPLIALRPLRPAVVGFDLEELITAREYYDDDPVPYLAKLARQGIILTATWHPWNPVSGGDHLDRRWTRIRDLLDPDSAASRTFWPRYEQGLGHLKRLQRAGAAVLFKPLHEAGGDWFWWGRPDPGVYRALYAEFQRRAAAAGVHNIAWGYAAAPRNRPGIADPVSLIPERVDLVGADIYDDEVYDTTDRLMLHDVRLLQRHAPRMALTEVGPYQSTDGDWNPAVITETLRRHGLYMSFAMLWRDGPEPVYMHQIASLAGGPSWLASCPDGLCPIRPPWVNSR